MKLVVYGQIAGRWVSIGQLFTTDGGVRFEYKTEFLENYPGITLSLNLRPQKETFDSRSTEAYFRNLLPEGQALFRVSRALEVPSSSYIKVLCALGEECMGAIAVQDEDDDPPEKGGYRELTKEEVASIASSDGAAVVAELQAASKLSLAGAQSKIGLYVEENEDVLRFALPYGGAASTHILKAGERRFAGLSENEHVCLSIAKTCGIKVPESRVLEFGGKTVFLIERYDRLKEARDTRSEYSEVKRLHQEDFCQVLGLLPERKYEEGTQHYVERVVDSIRQNSANPILDVTAFLKTLVINVVVGNCDGHLKNFSLLRSSDWASSRLAPMYDISSTVVYSGLDRHFAFRIGNTNKIDEISRESFLVLAEGIGYSKRAMASHIDEILEGVSDSIKLGHYKDVAFTHEAEEKIKQIESFAKEKIKSLASPALA